MISCLLPLYLCPPPPPGLSERWEGVKGTEDSHLPGTHSPELALGFLCLVGVHSYSFSVGAFMGSLEAPVLDCDQHLGSASYSFPLLPPYPALLVVQCIHEFHRSWNDIKLILSTSAQNPFLGQHWHHRLVSVQLLHFFHRLLLSRFLRRESKSNPPRSLLPFPVWRWAGNYPWRFLWGRVIWDSRHQPPPSKNPLFNFQLSFPLYPCTIISFQIHTWK